MNNTIDLPSLQSIELGNLSFVNSNTTIMESILLIWNEMKWIDLPSLQSIELGKCSLLYSIITVFESILLMILKCNE